MGDEDGQWTSIKDGMVNDKEWMSNGEQQSAIRTWWGATVNHKDMMGERIRNLLVVPLTLSSLYTFHTHENLTSNHYSNQKHFIA